MALQISQQLYVLGYNSTKKIKLIVMVMGGQSYWESWLKESIIGVIKSWFVAKLDYASHSGDSV